MVRLVCVCPAGWAHCGRVVVSRVCFRSLFLLSNSKQVSVGRVGSRSTVGAGCLFGVGLLIIEDHVPVVELVDTPDSKSGIRWGVWVRVPPGALAAEVFGVSSCRLSSTCAIVGTS